MVFLEGVKTAAINVHHILQLFLFTFYLYSVKLYR